jgi:peptide chain release factor 3
MLIDAAKGIEPQTRKLFAVCRQRGIPIFTFMNKLDRPAREPLDLLDELENILGIGAFPVNWPLGDGEDFRGVYDRMTRQIHLFERTEHGQKRAPVQVRDIHDPALAEWMSPDRYRKFVEDVELLDVAGEAFEAERVIEGQVTPVFFGSAVTNFGVESSRSRRTWTRSTGTGWRSCASSPAASSGT